MINQYPSTVSSGGGTVTPRSTTKIVNGFSTSGFTPPPVLNVSNQGTMLVVTNTGAVAPDVLVPMFSISGQGYVDALFTYFVTAPTNGSATLRTKLTIDGVVVFDSTSTTLSNAGRGPAVVGTYTGTGASTSLVPLPVRFNTSVLLEITSSTAVSVGNLGAAYQYRLD